MKAAVAGCLVGAVRGAEGDRPGAAFEGSFRFGADLEVFAGHFPGRPLVPGVFLVEAARLTSERALGRQVRIARVARSKFAAEVGPDAEVTVRVVLERAPTGGEWRARARVLQGEQLAALLHLHLAAAGRDERDGGTASSGAC